MVKRALLKHSKRQTEQAVQATEHNLTEDLKENRTNILIRCEPLRKPCISNKDPYFCNEDKQSKHLKLLIHGGTDIGAPCEDKGDNQVYLQGVSKLHALRMGLIESD